MISLDLETTGLDPERHEAWEVGLVDLDSNDEYLFEFPVRDLRGAEAGALQVNDYYARSTVPPGSDIAYAEGPGVPVATATWQADPVAPPVPGVEPRDAAFTIAKLTSGQRLMGCAIQFDMQFLGALLLYYDCRPSWHHRALDLGSFAAGVLGYDRPLSSAELSRKIHDNTNAHTALGDARWNVTIYRNLVGLRKRVATSNPKELTV